MNSLQLKLKSAFLCVFGALIANVNLVQGQANLVSSRIDLAYEIQAGGLESQMDDFDPIEDELTFNQSVGNTDTASAGEATAEAEGTFDFTSSLLEASGSTLVEVSNMGVSSASVNWELSFEVTSGIVFYSADLMLGGTNSSSLAGSPESSIRMVNSSGTELFAIDDDSFLPGSELDMHGVLVQDTYTIQAALETSTGSSEEGNTFSLDSEFNLSFALRRPELPLLFSCPGTDIAPIGICVEAIQPTGPIYVVTGFILTSGSAEPLPYSLEGVELSVLTDQQFELSNQSVSADLAVFESLLDGIGDSFPEQLFDIGTQVRTTLAFEPGSLSGNEQPEDLPIEFLLGGLVELLDPNGILIATNRLQIVPEPSSCVILMGVLSVIGVGVMPRRRCRNLGTKMSLLPFN